jgi:MSHA biogenesis protein MshL
MLRTLVTLTALLLVAGCGSIPSTWNESSRDQIDASLTEASGSGKAQALPTDISQALLPPIQIRLPEGSMAPLEARFDLSVSKAPARQVFMGLVEGSPYSMAVHPDVSGTITVSLKNVSVPEAIEAIRRANGYEYRREGNRFYVLEPGMQTRMFPVNYLNFIRKGRSNTQVSSGELTQGTTPGTSTGTTTGTSTGQASQQSRGPAGVQVNTESTTDFWKDLEASLKALVGTDGGRKVVANPQANLVVVRAMSNELRLVEDFLGAAHASVNRQVILEAKIIEVELKDGYQSGINWAGLGRNNDYTVIGAQTGGGTILGDGGGSGKSDIAGQAGSLFGPIANTGFSAFGGVFSLAVRASDFTAFLELLRTQGDTQVLSSPRVSTVNNQKAVIKVGGDEFFVTNVTTTTTTAVGGGTTAEPSVTLTPFFSGISLDVTPQIDENNNIMLHIHPSVSQVTQQNKTFKVSNRDFSLPLAVSTIQESDNVVRASSGQIVVIGGLMKEGSSDDNAAIPLVGDIPVIGNAFKHKKVSRIKKELVILLKPTVVDIAPIWGDQVQESHDRIKKLKRGAAEAE